MIEPGSPEFPAAKDDDDDDVAWALSTALVQWKRGSQADAVVWFRRAIDSAVTVGATWRAAELTRQTDALEAELLGARSAAPPSYPAPSSAPRPPQAPPSFRPQPGSFPPAQVSSLPPQPGSFPPVPSRSFPPPSLSSAPPLPPPPPLSSSPPRSSAPPRPISYLPPPPADADDYDGTDMIDAEVLSLPPDAEIEEPAPPISAGQHAYTAEDDQTTVHTEDETEEDIVEIDEIEADDIAEDDIAEDDLGEVDADDGPRARFASEAPTANLVARAPSEPETEIRNEIPRLSPAIRAMHASEAEEDPAPTPMRMSAAPPSEPAPEPEPASLPPPPLFVSEPPAAPPVVSEAAAPFVVSEPAPPVVSEPEPPPSSVPSEPFVAGISLAEIRGFEDFPPETQFHLARVARVERLATEEEVSGFGLSLVLRGAVNVMPTIADVACGAAGERELVYGRGTLPDGVPLRLVATAPDTQIAVWSFDVIAAPLADCPWVLEELEAVADRYQALAGVSMGPMGDRLDDSLRGMVLSRCRLVRLLPGEVLVEKGKPVGGLFIVGAGKIELGNDAASAGSQGELLPGDFLFAPQVLSAGAAPTAARAGASGALLMAADRHAAHELMLSVPPLLELLAG